MMTRSLLFALTGLLTMTFSSQAQTIPEKIAKAGCECVDSVDFEINKQTINQFLEYCLREPVIALKDDILKIPLDSSSAMNYYLSKYEQGAYVLNRVMYDLVLDCDSFFRLWESWRKAAMEAIDTTDIQRELADLDFQISSGNPDAEDYFRRGLLYYKSKDFSSAITDFTRVVDLDKEHVQAFLYRGWLSELNDELEAASLDYQKCLELSFEYRFEMFLASVEHKMNLKKNE